MFQIIITTFGILFLLVLGWYNYLLFGPSSRTTARYWTAHASTIALRYRVASSIFHWGVPLALGGSIIGLLVGILTLSFDRMVALMLLGLVLAAIVGIVVGAVRGLLNMA
ncbi:MAG: hypothetical protein HC893_07585 [Chloroflexaceae bacterium]|nr:hypothetical protein [Chloroflexaceae bacterium]NJL33732.1 hypothetical protein [Chloroflexaceae bacterium]NJO06565.1 hypothetical protein [Chloroflexaceae bacterium]